MSSSDLARIGDELALRKLVAEYGEAVVTRDPEAWGATWAEDAEWLVLGRQAKGREAIVALWSALMTRYPFITHSSADAILDVEGDRATGRWSITERGRDVDGVPILVLGRYQDEYVRTAAGWRFARRTFHALYQGAPDLSAEPTPIQGKV